MTTTWNWNKRLTELCRTATFSLKFSMMMAMMEFALIVMILFMLKCYIPGSQMRMIVKTNAQNVQDRANLSAESQSKLFHQEVFGVIVKLMGFRVRRLGQILGALVGIITIILVKLVQVQFVGQQD